MPAPPPPPLHLPTAAAVCLAALLERADELLLPALYAPVARSFGSTPAGLGLLTLGRALAQALFAPLGGLAGGRFHRGRVIAAGCAAWAAAAALFGAGARSVAGGLLPWAAAGASLALVVPSAQSLVADLAPAGARGRAFGALHTASQLGGALGAYAATRLGAARTLGLDGWRAAFLGAAALSAAAAAVDWRCARDPRPAAELAPKPGARRAALAAARAEFLAALRVPTFRLIVAQGVCGSVPWSALLYLTLWYQLLSLRAAAAAALVACFSAGYALGGVAGGALGDAAAARSPRHGRVLVAQASVLAGIPAVAALVKGLPPPATPAALAAHAGLLLAFGAVKAWPAPACNNCLLAEIAPDSARRTMLYAADRCLETAVAACATPLVGLLAARGFGFAGDAAPTGDAARDAANAAALGDAILAFTALPWLATLAVYSGLHFTYARDRAAAAAASSAAEAAELELELSGGEDGQGDGGDVAQTEERRLLLAASRVERARE